MPSIVTGRSLRSNARRSTAPPTTIPNPSPAISAHSLHRCTGPAIGDSQFLVSNLRSRLRTTQATVGKPGDGCLAVAATPRRRTPVVAHNSRGGCPAGVPSGAQSPKVKAAQRQKRTLKVLQPRDAFDESLVAVKTAGSTAKHH